MDKKQIILEYILYMQSNIIIHGKNIMTSQGQLFRSKLKHHCKSAINISATYILSTLHLCLEAGGYTYWSEWSACSKTCDGGVKNRKRSCTNPSPSNGGQTCVDQGLGPAEETAACYEDHCPSKLKYLLATLSI